VSAGDGANLQDRWFTVWPGRSLALVGVAANALPSQRQPGTYDSVTIATDL